MPVEINEIEEEKKQNDQLNRENANFGNKNISEPDEPRWDSEPDEPRWDSEPDEPRWDSEPDAFKNKDGITDRKINGSRARPYEPFDTNLNSNDIEFYGNIFDNTYKSNQGNSLSSQSLSIDDDTRSMFSRDDSIRSVSNASLSDSGEVNDETKNLLLRKRNFFLKVKDFLNHEKPYWIEGGIAKRPYTIYNIVSLMPITISILAKLITFVVSAANVILPIVSAAAPWIAGATMPLLGFIKYRFDGLARIKRIEEYNNAQLKYKAIEYFNNKFQQGSYFEQEKNDMRKLFEEYHQSYIKFSEYAQTQDIMKNPFHIWDFVMGMFFDPMSMLRGIRNIFNWRTWFRNNKPSVLLFNDYKKAERNISLNYHVSKSEYLTNALNDDFHKFKQHLRGLGEEGEEELNNIETLEKTKLDEDLIKNVHISTPYLDKFGTEEQLNLLQNKKSELQEEKALKQEEKALLIVDISLNEEQIKNNLNLSKDEVSHIFEGIETNKNKLKRIDKHIKEIEKKLNNIGVRQVRIQGRINLERNNTLKQAEYFQRRGKYPKEDLFNYTKECLHNTAFRMDSYAATRWQSGKKIMLSSYQKFCDMKIRESIREFKEFMTPSAEMRTKMKLSNFIPSFSGSSIKASEKGKLTNDISLNIRR